MKFSLACGSGQLYQTTCIVDVFCNFVTLILDKTTHEHSNEIEINVFL